MITSTRQVGDIWDDLGGALTEGISTAIKTGASILTTQAQADAQAKIAATNASIEQLKLQIAQKQVDALAIANNPAAVTGTATTGSNTKTLLIWSGVAVVAAVAGFFIFKSLKKR